MLSFPYIAPRLEVASDLVESNLCLVPVERCKSCRGYRGHRGRVQVALYETDNRPEALDSVQKAPTSEDWEAYLFMQEEERDCVSAQA